MFYINQLSKSILLTVPLVTFATLAVSEEIQTVGIVCAGAATIATEKTVCFINELDTGTKKISVWIGAGVNISAGGIIASVNTKSMLGVNLIYTLGVGENFDTAKGKAISLAKERYASLAREKGLQVDIEATSRIDPMRCESTPLSEIEKIIRQARYSPPQNRCEIKD